MRQRAAALGLDLAGCTVRDPAHDAAAALTPRSWHPRREKMTPGMAERLLRKPLYFGAAVLAAGEAAALVAGAANPSRRVIEAAVMTIGLAPGIATPSSFFLMIVPGSPAGPMCSRIAPSMPSRAQMSLPTSPSLRRQAPEACWARSRAWPCSRSRPTAAPPTPASTRCAPHWRRCRQGSPSSPSMVNCKATRPCRRLLRPRR